MGGGGWGQGGSGLHRQGGFNAFCLVGTTVLPWLPPPPPSPAWLHRDQNAARNIEAVYKALAAGEPRPDYLSRRNNKGQKAQEVPTGASPTPTLAPSQVRSSVHTSPPPHRLGDHRVFIMASPPPPHTHIVTCNRPRAMARQKLLVLVTPVQATPGSPPLGVGPSTGAAAGVTPISGHSKKA